MFGYHSTMPLNIKDPETERLAAEVATATGTTKTGAVRDALRERLSRLSVAADGRERELADFMEQEIWPQLVAGSPGAPSKAERERILGYGPDGV